MLCNASSKYFHCFDRFGLCEYQYRYIYTNLDPYNYMLFHIIKHHAMSVICSTLKLAWLPIPFLTMVSQKGEPDKETIWLLYTRKVF